MALGPTSLRARLTLWYTIVLVVPLAGFAIASYLTFARTLHSRTDAFIRDGLSVFARELVVERRAIRSIEEAIRTTVREVRFQDLDMVVLDAGRVIALSDPLGDGDRTHPFPRDSAPLLAAVRRESSGSEQALTVPGIGTGTSYRIMLQPIRAGDRPFVLAGVYPLLEVDATLQRIRKMFLIAIPLLVVSAAAGGFFLARRSLEPVSAMAARAAEIGASTLHERLPVAAADELGALARVLNNLLDRLEGAFEQQRRFMADASHELRTPVAIVRTEADVTLSRDQRSEQSYRDSMAIVQDAAARLTRIVDDIFLLARADAGHQTVHRAPLSLEDVVHDTVRGVRPIAERRNVHVVIGELVEAPFHGDADLLGRVVLNLLDNAIKHSPGGGNVEVALTRTDRHFEIRVVDAGTGIPPEAHPHVFDRFFRVDPARSRTDATATSGAGLGLAITRWIVEVHGGLIDLIASQPGHTEFRVRLPAA